MNNLHNDSVIVLDTHILIWYLEGIKLDERQIQIIEDARKQNNLYICAISIWEIGMLANKGKIAFSINVKEWINRMLAIPGLRTIDLSSDILLESTNLPNYAYKDPVNRLIIASTRSINAYLMTMDEKIIEYGNSGYIRLVDNK